jgi:hypothetical protein
MIKFKDNEELELEIIRAGMYFARLINASRQFKGSKDSRVHTSYDPGSQTLEIGGLDSGKPKKEITLRVTKW